MQWAKRIVMFSIEMRKTCYISFWHVLKFTEFTQSNQQKEIGFMRWPWDYYFVNNHAMNDLPVAMRKELWDRQGANIACG